jgi:hypothetical protein
MRFHDFVPTLLVYWEKPRAGGGGRCSIGSPYIEHGRVYDLLIGNDIDELMQVLPVTHLSGRHVHCASRSSESPVLTCKSHGKPLFPSD